MYVAFGFVWRFGIMTLLGKDNNENTPESTLIDAAVPYVVCALHFFSSYFSCNLRKRVDWHSPLSSAVAISEEYLTRISQFGGMVPDYM